ncbi:MAG: hypothetical protein U1F81_21485 [Verrucomicrobiaceae bacterium]|jgi:hypothetical protein|uniref:hypothetical protein n=1 Tax=Prosthecobacter sp. TaxID=1965333 RepID=UPI001A0C9997|nr:hypothetical protein [Prosthecobacter sp.]MBE2282786.1 hypothetical protein [Prosthecobacter sp.]
MRITLLLLLIPVIARAAPLVLETPHFTLTADAATGRVELHDRAGGITWKPANGQTHHLASRRSQTGNSAPMKILAAICFILTTIHRFRG